MQPEELPKAAKIILPYATRVTITLAVSDKRYLHVFFDTGHHFSFEMGSGDMFYRIREKVIPPVQVAKESEGIWLPAPQPDFEWTEGSIVRTFFKCEFVDMDFD